MYAAKYVRTLFPHASPLFVQVASHVLYSVPVKCTRTLHYSLCSAVPVYSYGGMSSLLFSSLCSWPALEAVNRARVRGARFNKLVYPSVRVRVYRIPRGVGYGKQVA